MYNNIMILDELKKDYGLDNPILLEDFVNSEKYNYDSMRMILSRLVKSGKIRKYSQGIYYFPEINIYIGEVPLDFEKTIEKKYISNNGETFGYYTGFMTLNQLGLTTQVPIRREITTNKETNNRRIVNINGREVILRKPLIEVTKDNVKYLQFMDIFRYAYDTEIKRGKQNIIKYIKENKLNKEVLVKDIFKYYPDKAKANLLGSGCWDELA